MRTTARSFGVWWRYLGRREGVGGVSALPQYLRVVPVLLVRDFRAVMDPEIWLSRTLRDGHGYNEELTYVQTHLDVPIGVSACRCLRCFPTRPASRSRTS